jgi:myo-inositol-1-phosphate synthase
MANTQKNVKSGNTKSEIAPAKGKLGVMIPGMGAVATTFVAGVEAVRKGIAAPIGSLTQMGTIRLGKRTDGRSPKINEFVPLADLNDMVFTGWDIFEDDMYSAARKAGVLEKDLLDQIKPFLSGIKPMKAVFGCSTARTSKRARTRWNSRSRFARTSETSASRAEPIGW